jgi:hypothetical protein
MYYFIVTVIEGQCCGSGIRCLFVPGKVSIRIRDEQPGSYFLELRNIFLVYCC